MTKQEQEDAARAAYGTIDEPAWTAYKASLKQAKEAHRAIHEPAWAAYRAIHEPAWAACKAELDRIANETVKVVVNKEIAEAYKKGFIDGRLSK